MFKVAIRTAFNRSDELVLETVVPDDPREISAIAVRSVTTGSQTVRGAAPLEPYFAHTRAVLVAGRSKGMSVDQGADALLCRFAVAQGRPVEGLERFEDQLSQLATIPMPVSPPPSAAAWAGAGQRRRPGTTIDNPGGLVRRMERGGQACVRDDHCQPQASVA